MTIVLNGEPRGVDEDASVDALVASLGRGPAGVAVAVNGEVVPRSAWCSWRLAPDDRVEVLTAAQGG